MARGDGDSSPLLWLGVGNFQGVSGAQTHYRVVAAPPKVCGHDETGYRDVRGRHVPRINNVL
jgi:hypothetical protein